MSNARIRRVQSEFLNAAACVGTRPGVWYFFSSALLRRLRAFRWQRLFFIHMVSSVLFSFSFFVPFASARTYVLWYLHFFSFFFGYSVLYSIIYLSFFFFFFGVRGCCVAGRAQARSTFLHRQGLRAGHRLLRVRDWLARLYSGSFRPNRLCLRKCMYQVSQGYTRYTPEGCIHSSTIVAGVSWR